MWLRKRARGKWHLCQISESFWFILLLHDLILLLFQTWPRPPDSPSANRITSPCRLTYVLLPLQFVCCVCLWSVCLWHWTVPSLNLDSWQFCLWCVLMSVLGRFMEAEEVSVEEWTKLMFVSLFVPIVAAYVIQQCSDCTNYLTFIPMMLILVLNFKNIQTSKDRTMNQRLV